MFIINHVTGAVSEGAAHASNYSGLVDKLQCPNRQNKCPKGQSSMPNEIIICIKTSGSFLLWRTGALAMLPVPVKAHNLYIYYLLHYHYYYYYFFIIIRTLP